MVLLDFYKPTPHDQLAGPNTSFQLYASHAVLLACGLPFFTQVLSSVTDDLHNKIFNPKIKSKAVDAEVEQLIAAAVVHESATLTYPTPQNVVNEVNELMVN